MKRTVRRNGRDIRCNRPSWRKPVIGRKGVIKFKNRGVKIKSKNWEAVE